MEVNLKKSSIIFIRPLKKDDGDNDIDEDDLDDT